MSLFVIGVVIGAFLLLLLTNKAPEFILGAALLLLTLIGAVSVEGALQGFSNQGLVTIAALYVVAAGLRESGALWPLLNRLMAKVSGFRMAQIKLLLPVAILSAFVNNTPIVAALIPAINRLCKNRGWQKSMYLLPLSYAAILGGTCTLIGTSTNLLVFGFLQQAGYTDFGLFDIAWVGIPITLAGLGLVLILSPRLRRDKSINEDVLSNTREYTIEMLVEEDGVVAGSTIESAGLRHLQGLYLVEIFRDEMIIPAVSPETILRSGDRLVFTGLVQSVSELLSMPGLRLAEEQAFDLEKSAGRFQLLEVIIGNDNPVSGKTVRACHFRRQFGAAVIAVVREGLRIVAKVGDIQLKAGDTLLLMAPTAFIEKYRFAHEFLILNKLQSHPVGSKKQQNFAWLSLGTLLLLAGFNWVPVVLAALLSALLMIGFRCISLDKAKRSVDMQVILVIAAAFGIGNALTESGAAQMIGHYVLSLSSGEPFLLLLSVYLLTVILTELITNSAAAVIAFSLASSVVNALGLSMLPFAVAIMIAASASFISPLGYQTNLMVFSAGGYRFSDFFKMGLPMSILVGVIAMTIIPLVWPF